MHNIMYLISQLILNCLYLVGLMFSSFIVASCQESSDAFEEKIVRSMELVHRTEYEENYYGAAYLANLNPEQRRRLCVSASLKAGIPFINDAFVYEGEVYQFQFIEEEDDKEEAGVLIQCPTVPRVYLRKASDDAMRKGIKMSIIIDGSFTELFYFDVEIVPQIHPVPPADIEKYKPYGIGQSWQEEKRLNKLYTTESEDRRNLCFVATTRLHRRITFSSWSETEHLEPEVYSSDQNKSYAYIAIDCKTTPNMYLRLKSTQSFFGTINIIFVQSDLTNEPTYVDY